MSIQDKEEPKISGSVRTQFKKGNPGRPKGSGRGQTIRSQLKSIAAEQVVIEGVKMTKGMAILRRIVNGALAADPVQQKYYLEYMYGKPTQPIELETEITVAPYNEENRRMALKLMGIEEENDPNDV